MSCANYSTEISAAAVDDIADVDRARLEGHLVGCEPCRAELARLRAVLAPAAEEAVVTRLRAAAREEVRAIRARGRKRRRLAVVLATAAAAAVMFVLLPGGLMSSRGKARSGSCPCWRFVDGDAGNSRHLDMNLAGAPGKVLWEQKLKGRPGAFKPLAWKELLVVGLVEAKRGRVEGGKLVALEVEGGAIRWSRSFASGDLHKAKGFPDRCIVAGKLYLADGRKCFVLDARTGEDIATYAPPAGATGWAYLAAAGSKLYGASGDGGSVFCVDAATGRVVWSRRTAGGVYVPAIAEGRMYLHSLAGEVAALDVATGGELWRRKGLAPGRRVSVHVRGDTVVCLTDRDEVLALDAASGEFAWQRPVPGAFASGLALGDEAVYLAAGTVAISLEDGRLLWGADGSTGTVCSAPTVAGDLLVAAAGVGPQAGSLGAFDAAGRLVGAVKDAALQACDGAIVSDGRVFTVSDGRVLALACAPRG